jgi:hypothetical protein
MELTRRVPYKQDIDDFGYLKRRLVNPTQKYAVATDKGITGHDW